MDDEQTYSFQKQERAFYVVTAAVLLSLAAILAWMNNSREAPLLVFIFVLGSMGALLSEHIHLRRALKSTAGRSQAAAGIVLFSPITGGILSISFISIMAAGLVQGDFFPEFKTLDKSFSSAYDLLRSFSPRTGEDFFKLCFWSIAAGYSERLVVQRLYKGSEEDSEEESGDDKSR